MFGYVLAQNLLYNSIACLDQTPTFCGVRAWDGEWCQGATRIDAMIGNASAAAVLTTFQVVTLTCRLPTINGLDV